MRIEFIGKIISSLKKCSFGGLLSHTPYTVAETQTENVLNHSSIRFIIVSVSWSVCDNEPQRIRNSVCGMQYLLSSLVFVSDTTAQNPINYQVLEFRLIFHPFIGHTIRHWCFSHGFDSAYFHITQGRFWVEGDVIIHDGTILNFWRKKITNKYKSDHWLEKKCSKDLFSKNLPLKVSNWYLVPWSIKPIGS